MIAWRELAPVMMGLILCGCGKTDSEFDSLVDEIWIDQNEGRLVPAAEYLRGGGLHFDIAGDTTVDRDLVIPLCEQIEQQHGAKCFALLYDDDDSRGEFTTEILVQLALSSDRSGIHDAIAAADEQFEGRITQQWGVAKWMTFSFEHEGQE